MPFDQPALFEPVQQAHELAAVDTQGVGDRPLRLALALAQDRQNAVVVGTEAEAFELLDRPALAGVPEPPEQKSGAFQEFFRNSSGRRDHGNKCSPPNRFDVLSWKRSTIWRPTSNEH